MLGKNLNEVVDHSKELASHSYNYYRLKIFEQTAYFSSSALQLMIIGGLGFIGVIFFAIAGGLYLNEIYESSYVGFLIVGLILLVIAGIFYTIRKRIENMVVKRLSKTFFEH